VRLVTATLAPPEHHSARTAFYGTRLLSQAAKSLFFAALFITSAGDHAAVGLSSVVVAMMAAAIVFGLPGGVVADRLGASRALTLGAFLRLAALVAALVIVAQPALAWAAAFLYSAASQVYTPSEMALVRTVEPRRAPGAHASLVVLQHAGHGVGMLVLAPLLFLLGGLSAMLLGSVLLLAATVMVTLVLAARLRRTTEEPGVSTRAAADLTGTLRFFGSDPRARYAAGALAFSDLASRAILVATPAYLAANLGPGPSATVALLAAGAVGLLLGLLWSGRALTGSLAPRAMRGALLITVVGALALVGLGHLLSAAVELSQSPGSGLLHNGSAVGFAFAIPTALALGAAFGITPVASRTVLTETAPRHEQARVFASVATLGDLALILPIALTGVSAELLGARPTLLFVGLVGVCVLAVLELGAREQEIPPRMTVLVPVRAAAQERS
jgi:MFS family permease